MSCLALKTRESDFTVKHYNRHAENTGVRVTIQQWFNRQAVPPDICLVALCICVPSREVRLLVGYWT